MKLQIQQKIQVGFAVALAFLLLTGVAAWWSEQRNAETFRSVEHTYQVLDQLEKMLVGMLNTETGYRGFVITGDETFLQPQQAGIAAVQKSLAAAKQMTQDNPDQQRRLAALEPLIQEKISRANTVVKLRRSGDTAGAFQFIATGEGKAVMDEIRRLIAEMENAEEQLLQQRSDRAQAMARMTQTIVTFGGVLSLVLVGLASILVRRDFEKRQRAEAERDRFFNLSLDLLGIAKTDGYFKRVNPAFTATLGWSAKEILARPFLELIHPDDRAATVREVEKLAAGQPMLYFENRFQCKDGTWKTLAWRAVSQPDGTFYLTGRDMTESKLAEENLRRSEENLAVTLESIGDAVLTTDTAGRVTRMNPIAEKLMGLTQAEALGRPVAEVFHIINAATREPSVVPVGKVLATGEIHGLANHTIITARDGTERPIADSAAPIRDKNGKILGVVLVFRDVSEAKKAEKAIRDSEERVRLATEAADIAVWAWDVNSRTIHWDERMFAFYGLPPKPDGWVNYEDWRARVLPADLAEQEAQLQRTVATCGHSQREFRIVRASDQAVRVIQAAEKAVAGADGKAVRVVGINIDITGRKRMEEIRARLAAIIEFSDDAIISKSLDGLITSWNPGAERLFGYTAAEIIGTPMTRLFPPDRLDEEAKILEQLKNGEHVDHFETVRVTKVGRQFDVSVTISPIKDAAGQLIGASKIVRDITDLKRAEEEIRRFNKNLEELVAQRTVEVREALATLDATTDGAYIFDPANLRFSYVNKGAVRQLGYTREELLGMTPLDLNTKHDEPSYREMIAPLIRGEKSVLVFESVYHRKDGGTIAVEINLQYIASMNMPPRFIAIVRDITERKKAEQQTMRSQRLESIGTLAGGISHDLNNALAPILLGVEILKTQYPQESQIVDMFEASARRGADMVRQLLTFAKGAEGERVALQPGHLVKELVKLMEGSFPKNIELVVKCDPKLPLVLGDATQLHQVLLNLCVNARDAMPQGGTLTLEAQQKEVDAIYASSIHEAKPGKYLALRVRDTGTGIPPEIIDRIFDPFFTTKSPDKGTGLGLSTVMGIVKGHGGFLEVHSQPGQGSTFAVYLPAVAAGGDTQHITKAAVEFRGQEETILFVDDERALREAASMVLRRLNFKPLTATDGADGLIQAAQHRTELSAIITDLHMPHMDGLEFVRAVRRLLPDIPIMVASGRMEDAVATEFKTLGVTNLLDKPFTEAQLAEALKTVFKK